MRILVVEDSWQVATAIAHLLTGLGAEVSGPAATSADALRLVHERLPDAALVDFNLRGGELAEGLIERLHQLGIYVIVVTGYTELPSLRRHAVTILHKPFSEAALIGSLRSMIARKAPPHAAATASVLAANAPDPIAEMIERTGPTLPGRTLPAVGAAGDELLGDRRLEAAADSGMPASPRGCG